MIRWIIYLIAAMLFDVVAIVLSPLLALTARDRVGPIDNNNGTAIEPRLPVFLSWFDTAEDNSLLGDSAHKLRHANSSRYWQMFCWLVRNHGYGFRWSVLAAPMDHFKLLFDGDVKINRNNGRYGVLRASMGSYWQYKRVTPIGQTGYCWMLNFGWLLDDTSQDRALFMFSPRIVKITGASNA